MSKIVVGLGLFACSSQESSSTNQAGGTRDDGTSAAGAAQHESPEDAPTSAGGTAGAAQHESPEDAPTSAGGTAGAAAGGRATSDDSDTATGGQEALQSCGAVHLDAATTTVTHSDCYEEPGDQYRCCCNDDCEGELVLAAATCDAALEKACGVDQADRETCQIDALGACRPAAAGREAWTCLCEGGDELVDAAGADCGQLREFLFSECAQSCSLGDQHCEPGTDPLTYVCQCDLYGERTVTWEGYPCEETLRHSCEPGHGLGAWGACTDEQGYCDQPDLSDPTWICQCLDGTSGEVTLEAPQDPEGPEIDCGHALVQVCGDYVPPAGSYCEREYANGRGRCDLVDGGDPNAQGEGALAFACECTLSCPDSAGAHGLTVNADSCDQALATACGVDGPEC